MARSERITAVISTVVAVAILAGGVTAYQTRTAPVEDIVQLESDFRFQLEVGFLHNHKERAARLEQLGTVKTAWQESPQGEADRTKLADWLLEATIRSMAGSTEALPPIPTFGSADAIVATPKRNPESNLDVFVEPQAEPFTPAVEPPTPALPTPVDSTVETAAPAEPSNAAAQPALDELTAASAVAAPLFRPRVSAPAPLPTAEPVPKTPIVPIRINLSELAARIGGYHAGLDEVELAISRVAADDFDTLAAQVRELKQLTHDYQFVSLYYLSLDESEQRWVEAPRGLAPTLAALQKRIEQAQDANDGDFLGDFDATNPDRIDVLRKQVAELTSVVSR